jgi:hypothetical protein
MVYLNINYFRINNNNKYNIYNNNIRIYILYQKINNYYKTKLNLIIISMEIPYKEIMMSN